ncbi:MAG TPA: TonB-dependent receptor [Bacteroidales bacterium]|nr:TonB-dependent receptor [Bacteroidales bacterium]HRR93021.1 TonB-dependent receptor [Bacteroidales bacterium]HRT90215.1 TonB-dependent receptor [Bacteroidales bacterium]
MRKLALVSFLFIYCLSVAGQQQEILPVEKLGTGDLYLPVDTVEMSVISASRSSKKISELPITIHVVTRDEIIRNHYYTLIDVIKTLPGVRVSQPGSGELGESFQLRGLTGNLYTMILINGLPVKPGVVTGMPVLAQLPVRQAERIEIIYGPAAAIYGADAVSGVINIITREADKGTFALADVSIGQDNFRNGDFMVGGKAGKNKNILQYTFYGGLNEIGDLRIKKGYEEIYNPMQYLQEKGKEFIIGGTSYKPLEVTEKLLQNKGVNPADFMREHYFRNYEGTLNNPSMEDLPALSNLLGFNLRFRGVNISHNNMYRRSHSSLGQTPYLYKYNNPQNFWGDNIRTTSLSYSHEWTSRLATTTNISNVTYRMDNNSNMGVTFIGNTDKVYRYSAGRDLLFEQLFTFMPANRLEIMSGLTYQLSGNLPLTNFLYSPFKPTDYKYFSTSVSFTDTVSANFGINPLNYHNFSAFAQSYLSLAAFRFMGGVRVDRNSIYGFSFSPRLAGLFILNSNTKFRGSVGFAYKAPPSSLAYQSLAYRAGINMDSLVYISIPNPGLEPEKYMSVELGMARKGSKRISYDISVYYNAIRNLILDRYTRLSDLNLPRAIINPDTATVLKRVNEKDAVSRLYGLQANILIDDIVKSINLDAEISLTFGKSSQKFPDILELATNFLGNFKLVPNHFGQLKVSMEPAKNLFIQVTSIWESSWLRVVLPFKEIYNELFRDYDGFYSMDVVADYGIGSNLSVFMKVTNLLNERYGGPVYSGMNTPLPYNPQAGRSFQFGLTYKLN